MLNKVITLREAELITGLTAEYLRRLCRMGKIENAQMIGKTYVVPEKWAYEYKEGQENTLSVQEAARSAGVSPQAVYLAVRSGKLNKIGQRITKDSFQKYMSLRRRNS